MTHDSAPAADTSHSHTDTSFTDTLHTSHDTWTDTSHHDTSHSDPDHSHHHHHHHHHHNHHGHGHNSLLDNQAAYPPPSYGSIVNERDGRRPIRNRRRRQQEEITFMELVDYFLKGVMIIGFICFFGFLISNMIQ